MDTSPYLNLYGYPDEVDYGRSRSLGASWHNVQTSVRTSDPWELPEHLRDGPGALLYLSLGSLGSADVGLMQRLVDILGATAHRVIVSKGPLGEQIRLHDNMCGEGYLPQPAILPQVDLVITHGGNNTTCEALHHGKPMVVLPLFWDQYDNAQRIHETGLGVRLSTYECADEELTGAVDGLLADAALQSRLAAMSKRLRSRSGTVVAADLIEQLASGTRDKQRGRGGRVSANLDRVRDQQRDTWDRFSDGWKKWDGLVLGWLAPYGTAMIRQAGLREDSHVLDVAAGTGEPGLTVAALIPDGRVTVTDLAERMLAVAAETATRRGLRNLETRACDAGALPFADASFDAVVACLVFEHIREVDEAISEVGRVLEPGGRFCFFLNHPLLQTPNSGWIDDHVLDPPEQYWRIGAYLVEHESDEEVEKDVFIPFIHRPLSRYVNTLAENGLVIERMLEPVPPDGFLERAREYYDAATIPRLLYLRTRRL
jgi:SAM-dependent methyltransferase